MEGIAATTRVKPWMHHGEGAQKNIFDGEGLMTPQEAVEAAEANWTVSDRPLYLLGADGTPIDTEFSATCRDDNDYAFSTVKSRHENFDNIEVAYLAEDITEVYGNKMVEAAWSLKKGAVFGMALKVSEIPDVEFKFLTGTEAIDAYLILNTSHDGSAATTASVTAIRLACTNAINNAIKTARRNSKAGSNTFFSFRHTSNQRDKIAQAQQALGIVPAYLTMLDEAAEKMAESMVEQELLERLFDELLPIPEKKGIEKVHGLRDDLRTNIFGSPTIPKDLRGTNWGVFQGVTEFFEHEVDGRFASKTPIAERRLLANFGGKVADTRQKAWNLLTV